MYTYIYIYIYIYTALCVSPFRILNERCPPRHKSRAECLKANVEPLLTYD